MSNTNEQARLLLEQIVMCAGRHDANEARLTKIAAALTAYGQQQREQALEEAARFVESYHEQHASPDSHSNDCDCVGLIADSLRDLKERVP